MLTRDVRKIMALLIFSARGTQAAPEAADVALMTDVLARIAVARSLARRADRAIQENLSVDVFSARRC